MHGEIFGFTADPIGSVSRLVLVLILMSVFIGLIVQLGVWGLAMERAKQRKRAAQQPLSPRTSPATESGAKTTARTKDSPSPELLSTAVVRYRDQVQASNPEPASESTEEHIIRSQKDMAAELFRSARVEQMQANRLES